MRRSRQRGVGRGPPRGRAGQPNLAIYIRNRDRYLPRPSQARAQPPARPKSPPVAKDQQSTFCDNWQQPTQLSTGPIIVRPHHVHRQPIASRGHTIAQRHATGGPAHPHP